MALQSDVLRRSRWGIGEEIFSATSEADRLSSLDPWYKSWYCNEVTDFFSKEYRLRATFLVRPGQGQGVHRRAGACSGFQVTETRQALKQGGSTEKRHGPAVRACSSGTQGIGQHAAPQSARPVHNVDGRTCSQADTACSAAASAVSTQKAERQKIYGVLPS